MQLALQVGMVVRSRNPKSLGSLRRKARVLEEDQSVRVTSFNMRGGGSNQHWAAILSATHPDILLVQETKDPRVLGLDLMNPLALDGAIWRCVSHGRWGSAVFAPGLGLTAVEIPGFEGWVVGGLTQLSGRSIYVFSVHLPPEAGTYIRAANSMLDRLPPILDGLPVILGGDWNLTVGASTDADGRPNRPGELELLLRLTDEFGLVPAWRTLHPTGALPQTLRWMREPSTPYHCDGIFLPRPLADRLVDASVLTGSPWLELSDHNPLTVHWKPSEAQTA